MILFKNDWFKEENKGAIVHTNTNNKTFLRYAQLLKTMGIENHQFPLALLNKDLANIDTHDPNLSQELQQLVALECKNNPWYYFREVLRAPASSGPRPVPIRANRGNVSLWWLFFNHVTSILIQPRQTGKSFSSDALMTYLMDIACLNTNIHLVTKNDQLRGENLRRIRSMLETLPDYLKLKTKKDTDNTEEFTIGLLGNKYHASVGQSSKEAAIKVGRGNTSAIIQIDEAAFIPHIEDILPSLLPSMNAAKDEARKANAPYGLIYTTTAGYLFMDSGKYFYNEYYSKAVPWTEKLFDAKDSDDLKFILDLHSSKVDEIDGKKYSQNLVLLEFNHRQLGYTDDWMSENISAISADKDVIDAEFFNKWCTSSESSPLPPDVLKSIRDSLTNDCEDEITDDGYIIRWYVDKESIDDRVLIMGLDTSDAIGNDDIAMVIRDAYTGEVVGTGTYNETNLVCFARWITNLLIEYPNITLVPERKSSGVMLIDHLLDILPVLNIDPFERIFNWCVNDCDINDKYDQEIFNIPFARRDKNVYVKYKKEFGYATSSSGRSSRDNLYGNSFLASCKYTGNTVRDRTLINQLLSLVKKNGRIDHPEKGHDDMCISWMLSYWFLTTAKNLDMYGLNTKRVLSTVNNMKILEAGGADAIKKRDEQNKIKETIFDLADQLKEETNYFEATVLKNKMLMLYKKLDLDNSSAFSINELLEQIEIEKKKKRNRWY